MTICTNCGAVFAQDVKKHICRDSDIPKSKETIYKDGTKQKESELDD